MIEVCSEAPFPLSLCWSVEIGSSLVLQKKKKCYGSICYITEPNGFQMRYLEYPLSCSMKVVEVR